MLLLISLVSVKDWLNFFLYNFLFVKGIGISIVFGLYFFL